MKMVQSLSCLWLFVLANNRVSGKDASATITSTTTTKRRDLQSSNARVTAEAFLCDDDLQEVSEEVAQATKPIGYEIRVCVRPERPTRNRGIVMRSIDEFTFYRNFGAITQPVVTGGLDQRGSLALCLPGQPVCSFKTKLIDDFFYGQAATITGTGTVSMEFESSSSNNRFLQHQQQQQQVDVDWRPWTTTTATTATSTNIRSVYTRGLQSALGGFAGDHGVEVEFFVGALDPPKDFEPTEDVDDTTWWQDAPTWLKILIIGGAVIILLLACCLCGLCLWAMRAYYSEEQDESAKPTSRESSAAKKQEDAAKDDVAPVVQEEEDDYDNGAYATPYTTSPLPASRRLGNNAWEEYDPDDESSSNFSESQIAAEEIAANPALMAPPLEFASNTSSLSTFSSKKPTKKDICFDAEEHPGTQAMRTAIQKTIDKFKPSPTEEYMPEHYRHIKKQLKGRAFFVCDDETQPDVWREPHKAELVELLRVEFDRCRLNADV